MKDLVCLQCKINFTFGGDSLNNRIKELRKERNATQDDLARAVGVTRQTIISLENGKYNASLLLAFRIAAYFGTNIENVFIYEEDRHGI